MNWEENWNEEERKIFRYFDGSEHVYGDPTRIRRRLAEALGRDVNSVLAEVHDRPEQAPRLRGELCEAIRYAFEMVAYDRQTGTGATEEHCEQALWAYHEFRNQKKTTPVKSPISSAPTPEPEPGSFRVGGPTTEPPSDCKPTWSD